MKLSGNVMLITGGGSGIGRGLAEAFQKLGNEIIIAGRREEELKKTAQEIGGVQYVVLDQSDGGRIPSFAEEVCKRFPELNVVINDAGIQRVEDLKTGSVADAEITMETNLLGPIRLNAAFMSQLLKQPSAAILNVTSQMAMVPAAMLPSYCASKAAMHSYTQSLRYQLRDTGIQVTEIIPPWVQTKLQGSRGMNPKAMPLDDFIAETMRLLEAAPDSAELVVERAKPLRFVERGDYDTFFKHFNDGFAASQEC